MKPLKYLLIFIAYSILMLASALTVMGQDNSKVWTLKDCIDYAITNNTDLQKSKLDEQEAKYKTKEVKGAGLPQAKGTASFDDYVSIPVSIIPGEMLGTPGTNVPVKFGTKYRASAGVEVQQMLFNPSYFVGLKAARSAQELYKIKTQMSEEEVIYNISVVYWDILNTEQQLQSIQSNINKIDSLYSLTQKQYNNDAARKVDLNRIKVNRTSLIVQKNNTVAAINQQLNYLQILMGMPVESDISLDLMTLTHIEVPSELVDSPIDLSRQSDIKALKKQKELLLYEKKNINAQYMPSLSAYGSYSYQAQRNEFNFFQRNQPWFNTGVVGLQLNVPIFDGFQKKNRAAQTEVKIKKLEKDIHKAEESKYMEHENSKSQLAISYSSIKAQEDNVQLADEVYSQTNLMYKEGLANLTELLDAESSLRQAKIDFTSEVIKYKKARLGLLKSEGKLQEYRNSL